MHRWKTAEQERLTNCPAHRGRHTVRRNRLPPLPPLPWPRRPPFPPTPPPFPLSVDAAHGQETEEKHFHIYRVILYVDFEIRGPRIIPCAFAVSSCCCCCCCCCCPCCCCCCCCPTLLLLLLSLPLLPRLLHHSVQSLLLLLGIISFCCHRCSWCGSVGTYSVCHLPQHPTVASHGVTAGKKDDKSRHQTPFMEFQTRYEQIMLYLLN